MIKFRHFPTRVFISKQAVANCKNMYGDDLACLMFESVKNLEEKPAIKSNESIFKKLTNALRPSKEMSIYISGNKDGDFFVHSNLILSHYNFESKKVPFNFFETLSTLKNFRAAVAQTKEDILSKVAEFNEFRRFPNKSKFFD